MCQPHTGKEDLHHLQGLAKVSLPYPKCLQILSVKEGLRRPTQSVPLHAPTYGTNPWQGQSMDYGGSFRPEIMLGFSPYTTSYGDMSSFDGGSSSVPNELRTSQTDDAPHVT
uniref:Uncharacterized protein n=1 Tax=Oryza nivara TaxID=4536 RepID=A0A0E0HUH3_ORYNI